MEVSTVPCQSAVEHLNKGHVGDIVNYIEGFIVLIWRVHSKVNWRHTIERPFG